MISSSGPLARSTVANVYPYLVGESTATLLLSRSAPTTCGCLLPIAMSSGPSCLLFTALASTTSYSSKSLTVSLHPPAAAKASGVHPYTSRWFGLHLPVLISASTTFVLPFQAARDNGERLYLVSTIPGPARNFTTSSLPYMAARDSGVRLLLSRTSGCARSLTSSCTTPLCPFSAAHDSGPRPFLSVALRLRSIPPCLKSSRTVGSWPFRAAQDSGVQLLASCTFTLMPFWSKADIGCSSPKYAARCNPLIPFGTSWQ
ncbi:hypothetical protein BO94DRAFT_463778 [Aspergillus sclerotioniger CBS 115572]|uniref:Uncharacterized protein n=1 Tax=Aspergillus sclerotioniger CBS 115572 TaxID=1450535 RepID=A0A317WUG4_9EURO|nr:hypothetical protein BO94DRAFT_463778 [Aspergillus sclerotioniger CBS 115572]PWY89715.1 hypothetical protein BO94DRAFT_463778 [Aspergillus sclerotioniger CBS 115572]